MQQVHRDVATTDPFPLDPAFGPTRPQPALEPGIRLDIIKLDPAGAHVVTYPGVVLANPNQPDWLVTEARWVNRTADLGGLVFRTGDRLIETFSTSLPYNCFAVFDPETDELRGWYANVTYPVRIEPDSDRTRVVWHDLFLDVIGSPSGYLSLRDEDELDESGLARRDPALHDAIVTAARHVMGRVAARSFPFVGSF